MVKRMAVLGMVVALSGCLSNLPSSDKIQLAPVPGVQLPFKGRVMVFAGDSDLARNLTIQSSAFRTEETDVKEGLALAKAARALLAKGFSQAEINDTTIRPNIVVKLVGKASWNRQDASLKLGCSIDAWTADGIPLGTYGSRLNVERSDYRSDVEPGFAQCLKGPVEQLLASPGVARLAASGFKDAPQPAIDAWMRSLGPIPALR
jgi:hypothetical protein